MTKSIFRTMLIVSLLMCSAAMSADKPTSKPAPVAADPIEVAPAYIQTYLQRDYLLVSNPEIDAYLSVVVDKLLQTQPKFTGHPHILVYSADTFSAFADVDGNILVATQTLRELESEDELAALLGHELAHLVHNHVQRKKAITSFPVGIEMAGALTAAADQLKTSNQPAAIANQPTELGKKSINATQNASLFWSDLLAPNWNRKQERQADITGLEMMRKAGYDFAAFNTLFSKLNAAQRKRSERLDLLRKSMIERASKPQAAQNSDEVAVELASLATAAKAQLSEKAINGLFDAYADTVKEYDTPEHRQELIAKQVGADADSQDKPKRSPLFAQNLRNGNGGALLGMDEAAIHLVDALQAGDDKEIAAAGAKLVGKNPAQKPAPANAKTKPKTKAAPEPRATIVLSPHLNLALRGWYLQNKQTLAAAERVNDWLRSVNAPAAAFLLAASDRAAQDPSSGMALLEDGTRRIGSARSFLPDMVTLAKAAQDEARAEQLTLKCDEEDKAQASMLQKTLGLFKSSSVPTGLYAECIKRLGRIPKPAGASGEDVAGGLLKGAREKLNSK